MQRNEDERFSYLVMCEAFIELLDERAPVTVSLVSLGSSLTVRYERGADVIQTPSGAKKIKGFKLVKMPLTSLRQQRAQALEKLCAIRLG